MDELNLLCRNVRRLRKLNCDEIRVFFEKDIYILDKFYTESYNSTTKNDKEMRIKIEESLFLLLHSKHRDKICSIIEMFNAGINICSKCGLVLIFFKYMNKKLMGECARYISVIKSLEIYKGEYGRFVIYCLVMDCMKKDNSNIVTNIILTEDERINIKYYLESKEGYYDIPPSAYSMVGVMMAAKSLMNILRTPIYDDETLNGWILYKRRINYLYTYLGCFDIFECMCREKLKKFYDFYITSQEVDRANRFGFTYKVVQNTVFIQSRIDKWYIEVDKYLGQSLLYHGNDTGQDKYHVQKKFPHVNIYKIFKYIHEHDIYSLKRFDRMSLGGSRF